MRSPCPSAGSPRAAPLPRGASTSARGRSPSAASQTTGSPISSPSASRATISSTATGGSCPRSLKPLRLPLQQALLGHLGEQALERDAVAALEREGARDLALAGLGAGGAHDSRGWLACLAVPLRGGLLWVCGAPSWRVLKLLRRLAGSARGLALPLGLGACGFRLGGILTLPALRRGAASSAFLAGLAGAGPWPWRDLWQRARRSARRPGPWSARPAPCPAAAWR